jgi:hypothetical protein
MQYDYKLIDITTLQGIKDAERLKAKGWDIKESSPFAIQFVVEIRPIEKVPKGDYFRARNGAKVYSQQGYCRVSKKYTGQEFEDINSYRYFKKGTMVEYNFTF